MKCFYQQANATVPVKRQHFILNFVPKRKLNFPKPNAQLKPLNPPSNLIDINKTLFSFGKGNNDKDYLFFRTNFILKYAKNDLIWFVIDGKIKDMYHLMQNLAN